MHADPPYAAPSAAVDSLVNDPRLQQMAREQSVRNETTTDLQEDLLFVDTRKYQQGIFSRSELLDLQSIRSRAWLSYAAIDADLMIQTFMALVSISPRLFDRRYERLGRAMEGASLMVVSLH